MVLLIVSFTATDAWASVIGVISLNFSDVKGLITNSYYVNSNIPSTNTGAVNTAKTLTATTYSSTTLSAGTTGYVLSPQFTTTTYLPSGTLALYMYTATTPALDGSVSNYISGTSQYVSLTTLNSNDIIYVIVAVKSTSRTPIISSTNFPAAAWTLRGSIATGTGTVWAYYVKSSNALSDEQITASLGSGGKVAFTLTAFGISGANYENPFDLSAPWMQKGTSNSKTASVNISPNPSTGSDFIIGGAYISNAVTITTPLPNEYTEIQKKGTGMTGYSLYKNYATTDSGQILSFSWNTLSVWAIIADAITPNTALTAKVSASAVNSTGGTLVTFFSNQDTEGLSTNGQPALSTFNVAAGTIPVGGYLQLKIVAPTAASVIIYWGNATKPSNFQIWLYE